jgi:hypothetical protein
MRISEIRRVIKNTFDNYDAAYVSVGGDLSMLKISAAETIIGIRTGEYMNTKIYDEGEELGVYEIVQCYKYIQDNGIHPDFIMYHPDYNRSMELFKWIKNGCLTMVEAFSRDLSKSNYAIENGIADSFYRKQLFFPTMPHDTYECSDELFKIIRQNADLLLSSKPNDNLEFYYSLGGELINNRKLTNNDKKEIMCILGNNISYNTYIEYKQHCAGGIFRYLIDANGIGEFETSSSSSSFEY